MRFVALMSGGIDSPVAAHLMLSRGAEVCILNMDNRPFSGDDEVAKVEALVRRLRDLHDGRVRFFTAPHGRDLTVIKERAQPRYTCLLCKKAMLRVADMLCDTLGADGIVMGDSMGQVASQTLHNMASVSAGIRHPIVRPLIGFDKVDIERIGKTIGTFTLSIGRTVGCTAAPSHPVTKADAKRVEEEFTKAGLDSIVKEVASSVSEASFIR